MVILKYGICYFCSITASEKCSAISYLFISMHHMLIIYANYLKSKNTKLNSNALLQTVIFKHTHRQKRTLMKYSIKKSRYIRPVRIVLQKYNLPNYNVHIRTWHWSRYSANRSRPSCIQANWVKGERPPQSFHRPLTHRGDYNAIITGQNFARYLKYSQKCLLVYVLYHKDK